MMGIRTATLMAGFLGMAMCADAQWVSHPTPGLPRTKDGKPNLTAPAPRTREGKPDLSGVWQADSTPIPELMKLLPGGENGLGEDIPNKYFLNVFSDFERGKEPLQPVALARSATLSPTSPARDNTGLNCLPTGVPMMITAPIPFKFVQTPGLVVVLAETDTTFRQIFTDGRKHPADPTPAWMGSSVGRWEGDTLVVETIGLNDRAQLDAMGHGHSESLRVTERYRRRDVGHMDVQLTLDDPKTLTRPVTVSFGASLRPDTDLIEYFCTENERDRDRIFAAR